MVRDEPMAASDKTADRYEKLAGMLRGARTMLIVMQDHPDPDAIGAAVGLRAVAHNVNNVQCSIVHGGTVGRGENRALVQYLDLNLRPIGDINPDDFGLVAMVDAQPHSGNASLDDKFVPHVVIDHHPIRNTTRKSAFTDIRSRYGSTATILWEYLEYADITPEIPVATAMLYGIRSDTQDLGREATQADIDAAEKLHGLANKRMLGQIQRGRVPGGYFQMLVNALREAVIYPNAIIASLGELQNADMLGEAADLFLRHEQVGWTMAYGFYNDKALVSVRTVDAGVRAEDVIRKIICRIGTGGGHATSAGGQVPLKKQTATYRKELEKKFRDRFLRTIGSDNKKGVRLVKG